MKPVLALALSLIHRYWILLFWICVSLVCVETQTYAQSQTVYTISGRVTDASNGDPVPFAAVVVKGVKAGATTDFDGYFKFNTRSLGDSLVATYLGYYQRAKKLTKASEQRINFQLEPSTTSLKEVEIVAGENPAWRVLRAVVDNKYRNDRENLSSYEFETYNKIEVDVSNISENFRKQRLWRQIAKVLDSVKSLAGEDGKPILPIMISENFSTFYYTKNPKRSHEAIKQSRIRGVGVEQGTAITQVVGSTFQQYNFYDDWFDILGKNFVSPIASSWKFHYDYELQDSLFLGEDYVYKIRFAPKRKGDLAFNGVMWITKEDWALKQIDMYVSKEANLNFIDKIKIQQELSKTIRGYWLPSKGRITIDIAEAAPNTIGFLAKFYTSAKNPVLDDPKPAELYDLPISMASDAYIAPDSYWEVNRHDTLSAQERRVYKMIDTLKKVPAIQTYVDVVNILINGYWRKGKYELGPILNSFAVNNVEGIRPRFGFRTNSLFDRTWTYEVWGAYGTQDGRPKFGGEISYQIDRKKWTKVGYTLSHDLELTNFLDNGVDGFRLFLAASRIGDITPTRPMMNTVNRVWIENNPFKGFNQILRLQRRDFNQAAFDFGFRPSGDASGDAGIARIFNTYEVQYDARYNKKEVLVEDLYNERTSLYYRRSPNFNLKITAGTLQFGTEFSQYNISYQRYQFNYHHYINYGFLGAGRWVADMGYIPQDLPYPLLKMHLGNPTNWVYNPFAFNLMKPFEFVSDRWASLTYTHTFEGLLLNSIPYVNRAKLRLLATGKVLYGQIRESNRNMNTIALDGQAPFSTMGNTPYVEVGYGIENIFKLIRIDFVHRLTYLDRPNARPFGVFASVVFQL